MTQSANPLRQYFRQPAIYLRLPTSGDHWPEGSINIPPNGELPVLPMTAIDEITYRTPDALFNGQAVVDVIQSCVPSIKNAWAAPAPDINALLTAVRIAVTVITWSSIPPVQPAQKNQNTCWTCEMY